MSLDTTPLKFGKYKGKTPEQVADEDPSYIVWLFHNTGQCSRGLMVACADAVDEPADEEE